MNVKRTKFPAHLLCGVLAGIGGFVYFMHVGCVTGTIFGDLPLSTIKDIASTAGLDEAGRTDIAAGVMKSLFLVPRSVVLSRKNKNKL